MTNKTKHIINDTKILGNLPSMRVLEPKFVYLATDNARCPNAEIFIKEGDHVNCCQVIGMRHAAFFDQPIHATVSGTFVGYEKHYHRSGKIVNYIKIQNDFNRTMDPSCVTRSEEEIQKLTREDMVQILKDCAMVGLGGSSFPTYIKFQTTAPIHTILINGIECEPFISADIRLMWELPHHILEGIRYTMQAFKCYKAIICVKNKHKKLISTYKQLLKQYPGIEIKTTGNYFPQGWELNMINDALGIKVPQGELPSKYGVINFNVSTMVGIYRAIKHNQPVIERLISVTGNGIMYPHNFRVVVGTHVHDYINYCGGYKNPDREKVFILGGPMMGASLPSDDCILTKTVTSVIVLDKLNLKEEQCVRCGSCVMSCPVGLKPIEIMQAMRHPPVDKNQIKSLTPLKCIECGLCTFSCTSNIRLLDYVRKAKMIAKL